MGVSMVSARVRVRVMVVVVVVVRVRVMVRVSTAVNSPRVRKLFLSDFWWRNFVSVQFKAF